MVFFLIVTCNRNPYKQGKELYGIHCEQCHMADGSGLVRLIPDLSNSELITGKPDALICLIRKGISLNPETQQEMPPNPSLNEVELANLTNYLRTIYTDTEEAIKVTDVTLWLKTCK